MRFSSVPARAAVNSYEFYEFACSARVHSTLAPDRSFERDENAQVVRPADGSEGELPFTGAGVAVNSTSEALDITGKSTEEASAAVISWLEETGSGAAHTNYKLRDWLFARQRYWGEPFPVVYPEGSDDAVAGMCHPPPPPPPRLLLPLVLCLLANSIDCEQAL
jgi:leucyl-tRNA synthetase